MTPTDILTYLAAILALLGIALLCVVIISMIQRIMSRLQLIIQSKYSLITHNTFEQSLFVLLGSFICLVSRLLPSIAGV